MAKLEQLFWAIVITSFLVIVLSSFLFSTPIQDKASSKARGQTGRDLADLQIQPPWIKDTKNSTLKTTKTSVQKPLSVFLWPNTKGSSAKGRHLHIFQDGINQSKYLRLVEDWNADPNVVWIVDIMYRDKALEAIQLALESRTQEQLPAPRKVVLVDFGDRPQPSRFWKEAVDRMGGRMDNLLLSIRSIAARRKWSDNTDWISVGQKKSESRIPYHHSPYVVRTDTIEKLQQYLRLEQRKELWDPIEKSLDRPVDVAHFWPVVQGSGDQMVGNANIGKFRFRVSQLIQEWGREYGWNTFVGFAGVHASSGRKKASDAYVKAMASTKILVVVQRDNFEDHYRLMEGLSASGACVFSDFMHGLPAGLENGTSIVIFSSAQELKSLIRYYIRHPLARMEIARRGREIAMTRHRSWHRMEEIVFGSIQSTCDRVEPIATDPNTGQCPWTVNSST